MSFFPGKDEKKILNYAELQGAKRAPAEANARGLLLDCTRDTWRFWYLPERNSAHPGPCLTGASGHEGMESCFLIETDWGGMER